MTLSLEKNRSNKRVRLCAGLGALFVVAMAIAWNFYTVRSASRWLAWSARYKAEVLANPTVKGELQHIEWDGWGWAGQDTSVYLVFDPTDSLSAAARNNRPGKFYGIPCEVPVVDQMERNWYAVQFYTNEAWGQHNALNCT